MTAGRNATRREVRTSAALMRIRNGRYFNLYMGRMGRLAALLNASDSRLATPASGAAAGVLS